MKNYRILAVNLGSTSTKIGLYYNDQEIIIETIRHPKQELERHREIHDQIEYRKQALLAWINQHEYSLETIDCLSFRCGLVRQIEGGIYQLNQVLVDEALSGEYGLHAVNLGMKIGYDWSQEYHIPAIVVDGPTTNELSKIAKISGFKSKERRSVFHALNQKRIIRQHCHEQKLDPFNSNFIVAHLGGGITVSAHQNLRAIDVTNGVDGEGPFSPERTGYLSHDILFELVKEYDYDLIKLKQDLYKFGGIYSYTESNDIKSLMEHAQDNLELKLLMEAMIYSITKSIGAMATVLKGNIDAILITGGIAYNKTITSLIVESTNWIAPCYVYPGEDELKGLAEGALRYLNKEELAKELV